MLIIVIIVIIVTKIIMKVSHLAGKEQGFPGHKHVKPLKSTTQPKLNGQENMQRGYVQIL